MLSISLCHHPSDAALAEELSGYLDRNLDVWIDRVALTPELDLVDAVETGASAHTILAILSAASVPRTIDRRRWEAVFRPDMLCLLADDCPFPAVLRRRAFLDVREGKLEAFRAARLWAIARELPATVPPECEELFRGLVDAPGCAAVEDAKVAERFLKITPPYFEVTLRIDARQRSRPSLATEACALLGLPLSRPADDSLVAVREIFTGHRLLLLVEGDASIFAEAGGWGRASCLVAPHDGAIGPRPDAELPAAIRAYLKGRSALPLFAELDRALQQPSLSPELIRAALDLFCAEQRIAEAEQLLASLPHDAPGVRDADRRWVHEAWGGATRAGDEYGQLALF